jgi:inorganic pyrophosphatase
MGLNDVPTGKDVPSDVNVIIEIAAESSPVKYEVDKDTGVLFVDRFLSTAMFYPCNYGYIPNTLSDDGDPVDVLVITPHPLTIGSVVRVRPIGMLKTRDESGGDAKILAVPVSKLTKEYDDIESYEQVSSKLINNIQHFFTHYKDNEAGKWVKVEGWVGVDEAKAEILAGVEKAKS